MMALAELLPSPTDPFAVILLKVALLILFAALLLACAVAIGLRTRHPQPDPLSEVHGDVPTLDFFSATAPPRKRPSNLRNHAGLGASEAGGRVIPSDASAGHRARGGADG